MHLWNLHHTNIFVFFLNIQQIDCELQLDAFIMAVERWVCLEGLWCVCVCDEREHGSRIPSMLAHYREVLK